ncbi:hypothetical protein VTI28DRAFT_1797 [Corynascus sepedonium]
MDSIPMLSLEELNAAALERFVYQRVDEDMVEYLAEAAAGVIQCDADMMPPPAQPSRRGPSARAVRSTDTPLPSLEVFIAQLVVSSNVQVPTLMSTLVYLRRLKSRLQPMAKGLRCTTHRIFLASLILAAKYLNDSSPKNKHWANYSVVSTDKYLFGFSRTEVNLMEKQLLFLLDWDLRITEEDLYREFETFLAPIRIEVQDNHIREVRRKRKQEQRRQEQEMLERQLEQQRLERQREREEEAALWQRLAQPQVSRDISQERAAYATPPSSRDTSRSRQATYNPAHSRGSSRDVSPPGLESSASSYAGSTSSRATTPSEADITTAHQPYIYDGADCGAVYNSPMDVQEIYERPTVPEKDAIYLQQQQSRGRKQQAVKQPQMLPYEISAEQLRSLEESNRTAPSKKFKGVFGRVFGTAR